MLHFELPARRQGKTLAQRIMTPAHYIRLRRGASGLSIEQVAERLMPRADFRPMTAAFLRSIETDGFRANHREHIERLASAFPLDPDVYFQIVNEPADRLPRICMGCGCSAYDPCTDSDGVCTWSLTDACNRCLSAHADRAAA